MDRQALVELTADIVTSQVANNPTANSDVPKLVQIVHEALAALAAPALPAEANKVPAVPIARSVRPDTLICLACGQKRKAIKRHLDVAHGWTPAEYRAAYGLPGSYPMTAPNTAKVKRERAVAAALARARAGTKAKAGREKSSRGRA